MLEFLRGLITVDATSKDKDARYVALTMLAALAFGGIVVMFGASEKAGGLLWAVACSSVGWVLGFLFGIPRSLSSDTARTGSAPIKQVPEKSAAVAAAEKQLADANASKDERPIATAQAALDAAQKAAVPLNASQTANASSPNPGAAPTPQGPSTAVNTNLEQISDWLTKIIVGVTLVELPKVLARLDTAANIVAGALGGTPAPVSFAYALMVYFSTSGFLGSYLLTRLYLQRAFNNASQ